MIGVALVTESILDRGVFMPNAQQMTGENHVTEVDRRPGISRLGDDLKIIEHFSDGEIELSTAVTYVGFLVGGLDEDVDEFLACTRGMPHVPSYRVRNRGVRAVVVAGSLDQWRVSTVEGCRAQGPVREAFNQVHSQLVQRGLSRLFDSWKTVPQIDGGFLLEKK